MAATTVNDFYLRYAIARLSAYRNVWWSIANEYDLVRTKTLSDWDRFFRIVQAEDPYSHLRSIHHSRVIYDHSKPWCTHASLQSYDFEKSADRGEYLREERSAALCQHIADGGVDIFLFTNRGRVEEEGQVLGKEEADPRGAGGGADCVAGDGCAGRDRWGRQAGGELGADGARCRR